MSGPASRGAYALATLLRDLQALKSIGASQVQVELGGRRYDVVRMERAGEDNTTVVLGCQLERG